MIEAGAKEVAEEIVIKAIAMGHEANQAIIKIQEQIQQTLGKPKAEVTHKVVSSEVFNARFR